MKSKLGFSQLVASHASEVAYTFPQTQLKEEQGCSQRNYTAIVPTHETSYLEAHGGILFVLVYQNSPPVSVAATGLRGRNLLFHDTVKIRVSQYCHWSMNLLMHSSALRFSPTSFSNGFYMEIHSQCGPGTAAIVE